MSKFTPRTNYDTLRLQILEETPQCGDYQHIYTRGLEDRTGVPAEVIRAILRELREENMVWLTPTCDEDTGRPSGSGWQRTQMGDEAVKRGFI